MEISLGKLCTTLDHGTLRVGIRVSCHISHQQLMLASMKVRVLGEEDAEQGDWLECQCIPDPEEAGITLVRFAAACEYEESVHAQLSFATTSKSCEC